MAWPIPMPAETGDEVADLAAFLNWEQAIERHHHPDRFDTSGNRLPKPREFDYYLGVPEPSWLGKNDIGPDGAFMCGGIPKFVSAARLARYHTDGDRWPVSSACAYAIDSGAYIALSGTNREVPWFAPGDVYGGMILRFMDNNGYPPDFCAPQDVPCEPSVRAKTGLTVRQHLDLTLESYLFLAEEFPMVPWIPVLQGWEPEHYRLHERMYQDAGVDLAGATRVGIGSICRRGHLPQIVEVIEQFADAGYRMHGFGIKTTALPVIGHLLRSADSMAWSTNARKNQARLPGCTHAGDCRNCYRYAVNWREKVLSTLTQKPAREEIIMAALKPPAGQGDLLAGLLDLTTLVANKQAAAKAPAPKAPRPRRAKKPEPVVVPDDKLVTPEVLDRLGKGTLFRYYGSSIAAFDHLEDGDRPGNVIIHLSTGTSFWHGVDERTLRVLTPGEAEYERRLHRVAHPCVERKPLGTVKAGDVADGVFVQAEGMLPTGETATLTGYVISVMTVVRNYQGWTKHDCCAVTISELPGHLDGVQIEMSPDAEMTVLATDGVLRGGLPPLPAGTPAPWTKPTVEELLADAGLTVTGGPEDGPGTVTWRMPWHGADRTEPAPGNLPAKALSQGGGPVGNWRWILKQDMVDKAIADGVWPHPVESGPRPLHLVREGATGSLAGLVDGREETVHGEFRYFWTRSAGASCSPTADVVMKVATGPGVMDWKMVTVVVPWTGATFHLGDATPPAGEPEAGPAGQHPADLFDLLKLTSAVADAAEAPAAAGPKVLALADVPWGTYGTVSAGWGPDGSKSSTRTGYLTETARVYTGGLMGHAKDSKRKGEPLLICDLEIRANGSSANIYAPLDATFTVEEPPADHPLKAEMRLSRRLPFADVRPGDVFYLWDERDGGRDVLHHRGFNVADLRTRYHVQDTPRQAGSTLFQVRVLVDGEGPAVEMSHAGQDWVDIVDPREEPWEDGSVHQVNWMVIARRKLADRLGPEAAVLIDPDGVVVVSGADAYEDTVTEVLGRPYRWWLDLGGQQVYQPVDAEPYGPVGGYVGAAGDGYDEARKVLADSELAHYGFCLPRDELPKPVWERVHQVLLGMGATGSRQLYDFKPSRLPDLRAFIAGGPAPLTFTGVCPDCGAQTEPVPAEGDGETWKSAEQWLFLALQKHRESCPGRASDDEQPPTEAEVSARISALLEKSP